MGLEAAVVIGPGVLLVFRDTLVHIRSKLSQTRTRSKLIFGSDCKHGQLKIWEGKPDLKFKFTRNVYQELVTGVEAAQQRPQHLLQPPL
jgi:hypothetical protein